MLRHHLPRAFNEAEYALVPPKRIDLIHPPSPPPGALSTHPLASRILPHSTLPRASVIQAPLGWILPDDDKLKNKILLVEPQQAPPSPPD